MGVFDLLFGGPAGAASAPGDDMLDKLLKKANATPGINPNPTSPSGVPNTGSSGGLAGLAAQGNFGGAPAPTGKVPERQINQVASGEGFSLIDKLLGRLGKPGRALMPISNFIGGIADDVLSSAEGAARRGTLGAIAPEFTAGVQRADQSDLQRQFIEAQIGRFGVQNAKDIASSLGGPGQPKAQTEIAKAQQDLNNGLISKEVFDAKVAGIVTQANNERFDQTQSLRGEFNKETAGIRNSLQSLAAAQSLLAAGSNPISELAAFISTIKSIDNSTVREGELNNFNKAIGLVGELEQLVSRASGEGFTEGLAKQIEDTVTRIRAPLDQVFNSSKKFFEDEAGKFKLDPTSITGIGVAQATAGAPADPLEPPPVIPDQTIDPSKKPKIIL